MSSKKSRKIQLKQAAEKRIYSNDSTRRSTDAIVDAIAIDENQNAYTTDNLQVRGDLFENINFDDEIPSTSASKSKIDGFKNYQDRERIEPEPERNRRKWCLMDLAVLFELFKLVCCAQCKEQNIKFILDENIQGFSVGLSLICEKCEASTHVYSSPRTNDSKSSHEGFEVNKLLVMYSHEVGLGYRALQKFSNVFGMHCIHRKTYDSIAKVVCNAAVETSADILNTSVQLVRSAYRELGVEEDDDGILNIDVSYDGTWHKRGHTSHYGIGCVIDIITGYVIDFEVLSTFCHACTLKENDEDFDEWMQSHESDCAQNFTGSANAMETNAALTLWSRSIVKHKLRYTGFLGDGDSKAYDAVVGAKPYGGEMTIFKEECINHVSKRMGTALRKLAKEGGLGGRGHGKLTNESINKIQDYYRGAIINNIGNTEAMRENIWAIILHCMSTDASPHHNRCPATPESWCFYQRSFACGEDTTTLLHEHNVGTPLSYDVSNKMVPVFQRLSDPNLLQRLARGKTQNANESLHSVIWNYCPKTVFVGKRSIDVAVATAVSQFNSGANRLSQLMKHLYILPNQQTETYLKKQDTKRISQAEKRSEDNTKKKRRLHELRKRRGQHILETEEGPTYAAGGF